ncbi:MAG: STAS domain-containing protein [Anaerolineales bacterium]|jgi:anti-sigma B factor antagonist|nr:STAS domain-containing protein [Anaerolineales bacterium]
MEINITEHKRCDVVSVAGRVDSFTAPKLGEALTEITNSGKYHIVIDMTAVEYVSSAGLRVLIDTQKTCKHSSRGEVVLVGVPKPIYDTLDLAGFVPLFRFSDDLTTAVGSF